MKKALKAFAVVTLSLGLTASAKADDVYYTQNTVIGPNQTISANIYITNGTLTVRGTVEGNIYEFGFGSVVVNGGLAKGNIEETAGGSIRVLNTGEVEGNLTEMGNGSATVSSFSLVKGNVFESDGGDIIVDSSLVEGNLEEAGAGSVIVRNVSLIKGNVFESEAGTCKVDSTSDVEGSVECD